MIIEIGVRYVTRGGGYAVVENEYSDEPIWQLEGKIFDKDGNYDRLAYWTSSGRYSDHKSDFDIVARAAQGEENDN